MWYHSAMLVCFSVLGRPTAKSTWIRFTSSGISDRIKQWGVSIYSGPPVSLFSFSISSSQLHLEVTISWWVYFKLNIFIPPPKKKCRCLNISELSSIGFTFSHLCTRIISEKEEYRPFGECKIKWMKLEKDHLFDSFKLQILVIQVTS